MSINMATEKKLMYGLDPSKYPSRLGQPWKEDEVVKLLKSIQKKKSIKDIAKEHDRTEGGIKSYIRKLAVDYHLNDKRPMEEIQRFTGLTREEIEDAIKKRELKDALKEGEKVKKEGEIKVKTCTEPLNESIINDINELRNDIHTLKTDVKEILRRMNALYEFESSKK